MRIITTHDCHYNDSRKLVSGNVNPCEWLPARDGGKWEWTHKWTHQQQWQPVVERE